MTTLPIRPQAKNELRESIDTPLTLSNRLLLQFDFAGVDPYLIAFSRLACINFRPSTAGERLFNHCLTNIPVTIAADDNLQFGWNEQSIYRNYGVHLYEYEHFLLVASLGECLPEAYAAAVLCNIGGSHEDSDRINPPVSAWRSLLRSINGLLTATDFPLILDERMRLDPYRVVSGHSTTCTNALIPPAQFAKAITALGDLTLAGEGEMTLVGGNFLAWFAAFAELFLGINVEVSSRDGHKLHTVHTDSKVTLHLIFVDDINSLSSTVKPQSTKYTALTVMCSPDAEANKVPRVPFTGRVAWDGVLPKVFEQCFHKIAHQESKVLVKSIGGIARIFQIFAEDPQSSDEIVATENRANAAYGTGKGLIQTICNWFPELRHLQGRLERLQTMNMEETAKRCEDGARGLVDLCRCTICSASRYADIDPGTLPQSFCLLAVTETILNLGLAMSRVAVAPQVYPLRAGIICMYQRQCEKLIEAKNSTSIKANSRIKILFTNDWNANYSRRLQNAAAIFAGSWPVDNLPNNLVGLTHEGISVYVNSIQRGDARKQDADLIRIQNGNISWNQKVYTRVCRGSPEGHAEDYTWEAVHTKHMSQDLYLK